VKIKESSPVSERLFSGTIQIFLIAAALIAIVPLLTELAMSFSSKAAADRNVVTLWPVEPTLASWKYILSDGKLWRSFFITVTSTLIAALLALAVTSLMAYPLSKNDFAIGRFLMLGVVVTMIFKAPIVPYFLTLKFLGFYNNPAVLVFPHILSAYNLAIMRTFFKQFPSEVEDAARIDGCGTFRTLLEIILPSSKAVLASVGLFYAVAVWNQFQHPMMFIQKMDYFPLQLKIRQLINSGADVISMTVRGNANYTDATLGAATVIFSIVPAIAVYPWLQKYFAKGAMLGSVKG
jgi:putative aldouronate transport system permease protein